MDWLENIQKWQALPPERKALLRWEAIPLDVSQSMAFEGEPVDLEWLEEIHRRTETPVFSERRAGA